MDFRQLTHGLPNSRSPRKAPFFLEVPSGECQHSRFPLPLFFPPFFHIDVFGPFFTRTMGPSRMIPPAPPARLSFFHGCPLHARFAIFISSCFLVPVRQFFSLQPRPALFFNSEHSGLSSDVAICLFFIVSLP